MENKLKDYLISNFNKKCIKIKKKYQIFQLQ